MPNMNSLPRFCTESIAKAEHLVYEKLMGKYQNRDPFKYILYSAKIGEETPAMSRLRSYNRVIGPAEDPAVRQFLIQNRES